MFQSELTAAHLWYLRKPSMVNIHDIFTIIFQDLTLRRVLHLKKRDIYPTDRSKKPQLYFKFIRGINYYGYKPKAFEKKIITPFEEHDELQAKTLTNKALKSYGLPTAFISEEILSQLKKDGYIRSPFLLGMFGAKRLTNKSKQLIEELNQYLEEKKQILLEAIDNDRKQFVYVLEEMQSLIFFVIKDNPELYEHIISNVKWVHQTKPFGDQNDLSSFVEALNIDLGYLEQH
jgi:hypothetical protein